MISKKISRPKKIGVPLTEKCHLRCHFCFNSDQFFEKGKHLDFNEFKRIVDWLVLEGIRIVDLTPVVGEPLAIENLSDYLDYLDSNANIDEYELFTSLAAEGIERLFGRKKLKLTVSLYGLNEKQYFETTKVKAFKLVKKNLRLIVLNKFDKIVNVLQRCLDVNDADNELRIYLKITTVFFLKKNYSNSRNNEFAKNDGEILPCKFMHEPIINDKGISLCCMDSDNKRKIGSVGDSLTSIYENLIEKIEQKKLNCNKTCGWFELLDDKKDE